MSAKKESQKDLTSNWLPKPPSLYYSTKKEENKDMHEQYACLFLCLVSSKLLICLWYENISHIHQCFQAPNWDHSNNGLHCITAGKDFPPLLALSPFQSKISDHLSIHQRACLLSTHTLSPFQKYSRTCLFLTTSVRTGGVISFSVSTNNSSILLS